MALEAAGHGWKTDRKVDGRTSSTGTGANLYRPGKKNYLEGTDVTSARIWIDKYCTKNPLSNAAKAAEALIEELTGRS